MNDLAPSCLHTCTVYYTRVLQHCARTSMHAPVEPAPRRRVAPCRGSDSCPIKARLCVFSRPLPRRPALSPYFQPVCTPHPGLPAHLGGYPLAPAGVVWNDLRREKREFCVSPLAVSVFSATMNIFRLTGDLSHLAAIIILLLKIWKSRSCAGEQKTKSIFTWSNCMRVTDRFAF